MTVPLYVKIYDDMVARHQDQFDAFKVVHNRYQTDRCPENKTEFDEVGKPLVRIIEDTENRLCMKMENSRRGKFSGSLSDKFRSHVRTQYPLIDLVGVTIS